MMWPGRLMRVMCMAAIVTAASCGVGWAQPGGADPSFERMRGKLKTGSHVTVDLQNGLTVDGRFVDAGPDALALSTSGGERRISRSEVARIRRHGRGVVLGAIIGGGIGLASGAAVGSYFYNEGHDRDGPFFGLTALGLGLGIGLDALMNVPRTVYQRAPSRTALRMEAGPHRTVVRLMIGF
jgi:hypothetical protein